MKLLREVPTDRVFADFRDHVAAGHLAVGELIAEVSRDAAVFAKFEKLPADSVEGLFHYRVIRALDTGAVTPVLLWLLRWSETELPAEQRHRALRAIESWLVRRTLARLTGRGVNQVALDLLKSLHDAGPATAGEQAETFLSGQTADARLWPDDDTVRTSLAREPVYTALLRPRLRMILEALEDDLRRSAYGEGQPCPRALSVEHIAAGLARALAALPHDDDEAEAVRRDRRVQRLGNLTLVSGRLNPALSNRPWTTSDETGKRDYLLTHSHLKLNAKIVAEHPDTWTETDIASRTAALTERLLALWPRPAGASTTPVAETAFENDAPAKIESEDPVEQLDEDSMPSHTGKYRTLWSWLQAQDADEIRLSFAEVEQILNMPLPPSARNHLPHWYGYGGTALGRAIRDAGWKATQVNLTDERLTFVRDTS